MNPQPKHILVFRFGQIGDTVAALPCLWALRRQFPKAKIVLLNEIPAKQTHVPPEKILPPSGLVDGFEHYPGGASLQNFFIAWRLFVNLRKRGFSTLVYLVPSGRTIKQRWRDRFFFWLCGIRQPLALRGFSENSQPKSIEGKLLALPKEADALLERLRLDGLSVPPSGEGCMDLCLTTTERQRAKEWWHQKACRKMGGTGWVAVCLGGKTSTQLWPLENYSEVVRRLIEQYGLFPVIIGGREDRVVGEKLVAQWGIGLCAAGELSVRESSALMEGARFYLGNDTGVMHLAAAVGLPCVGVFSARNWPGIWDPYGAGHKVLRFEVPCTGCHLAVCNRDLACLRGVEVNQVYTACEEIISSLHLETLDAEGQKY